MCALCVAGRVAADHATCIRTTPAPLQTTPTRQSRRLRMKGKGKAVAPPLLLLPPPRPPLLQHRLLPQPSANAFLRRALCRLQWMHPPSLQLLPLPRWRPLQLRLPHRRLHWLHRLRWSLHRWCTCAACALRPSRMQPCSPCICNCTCGPRPSSPPPLRYHSWPSVVCRRRRRSAQSVSQPTRALFLPPLLRLLPLRSSRPALVPWLLFPRLSHRSGRAPVRRACSRAPTPAARPASTTATCSPTTCAPSTHSRRPSPAASAISDSQRWPDSQRISRRISRYNNHRRSKSLRPSLCSHSRSPAIEPPALRCSLSLIRAHIGIPPRPRQIPSALATTIACNRVTFVSLSETSKIFNTSTRCDKCSLDERNRSAAQNRAAVYHEGKETVDGTERCTSLSSFPCVAHCCT